MSGRPPRVAQWLLLLLPLGTRRTEIEGDLLELFESRAQDRGRGYAKRRYYADVLSLWRHRHTRHARAGKAVDQTDTVVGLSQIGRLNLREIQQDLSYGVRLLGRSPAVVIVAIVGLGLAIGVSTSVFSLINAAVFRSSGIESQPQPFAYRVLTSMVSAPTGRTLSLRSFASLRLPSR